MKKTDRQLGYILLLQGGKTLTAEKISQHFEVCKRTVYRDIQAISEAGVPIISLPGKGYQIMDGYYLPPVTFTPDEATALYIASQFARQQTDASIRADLNSVMDKIESILPEETHAYLARLKSAIHLSIPNRSHSTSETRYLVTIKEAIVRRQLLRLRYHAATTDQTTDRAVEPMWLLYYGGTWHMIGYCRLRNDLRDFRVDRIKHIMPSSETFTLREQYKLEDYIKQQRFEGMHEVKVRFTALAANYARRWFHWGTTKEVQDGDHVIVTFLVDEIDYLWRWLISFGTDAEVLSPISLREKIAEEACKIASMYSMKIAKAV